MVNYLLVALGKSAEDVFELQLLMLVKSSQIAEVFEQEITVHAACDIYYFTHCLSATHIFVLFLIYVVLSLPQPVPLLRH